MGFYREWGVAYTWAGFGQGGHGQGGMTSWREIRGKLVLIYGRRVRGAKCGLSIRRKGHVMLFVLLWVAIVSTALFWVAMHAAWIDRLPVWPLRILLLIVFALVPLKMFGTLVRGATNLSLTTTIAPTWLGYAWSQLSAYVAGAALILYWGRRRQADARPAAAHWRIWPLMLGWFVSGVVWSAVFAYMDHAWLARYAEARSQAKSNYLAHMTPNSAQAATAAHLYEMAFARLVSDPDTKMRDLPSLWYGDFDVNNPTLVAYLGRERLTITYLRQAATFQGCRFEQDTADPNISGTGPDQPTTNACGERAGLDPGGAN